jgi:hypothetical protein
MEVLGVVDDFDESDDLEVGSSRVAYALPSTSSLLSVFMKRSALALS